MAGLLGLDPQTLAEIKDAMSQLGLGADPEKERKAALTRALFSAGGAMLSSPAAGGWQGGLGRALQTGAQQYGGDLMQQSALRGQNMQQALQLMALARQNVGLQGAQQFVDQYRGNGQASGPSALPAGAVGGSGMGGGTASMFGPSSQPGPVGGPGAAQPLSPRQRLLNMGVPPEAIDAALAVPEQAPQRIAELATKFAMPHYGQGTQPMFLGPDGTVRLAPVQGLNEALAAQTRATEGAKAEFQPFTAQSMLPGGAPGPSYQTTLADFINSRKNGPAGVTFGGRTPDAFQKLPQSTRDAILQDMRTTGTTPTTELNFSGIGGGTPQVGTIASPQATKQAEAQVSTQAAQNTKIAEKFGQDYTDALTAEKQAPATIQKYQQLKSMWSQVETGKLAPTVQNLKAIAAYVAPDVAKQWTNDVPYYQAATALSNAMALELRNPAGGAGMPGSLSDADRQYLQSMISTAANDPRAIPMILDAKIALEKRNQDLGKIARNYRLKNNGVVDEGLYQAFQDYSDSHPLFANIKLPAPAAGGGKTVNFSDLPK